MKKERTRVLWTTNIIFPYPARQVGIKTSVYGGWMIGLCDVMFDNDNYEFAVATTYRGKKIKKYFDGKVVYYLVPCCTDVLYDYFQKKYWKEVVEDFRPDLIHAHGTEYAHNLVLKNACPEIKMLVSVQGILTECAKCYLAGIPAIEYVKNSFFTTPLIGDALFGRTLCEKRSRYEKVILKKCTAITGRTSWDKKNSLEIAGDDKPYYACNEILRNSFYSANWDIEKAEPHSIYISQANYPIKGFHAAIPAISELSKKYPDLKVYIAGKDIVSNKSIFKQTEYSKIIKKLIKRYGVEKNLVFTGPLTEKEVLDRMLVSNLYLQCSVMENSSNSLGEAMLIGMPCVASNVGGTKDLLTDKKEGLLYEFNDAETLVRSIDTIFSYKDKALAFGKNAQKRARITHDKKRNAGTMLNIYQKVLQK